jgi:hypothetical protein
MTTEELRAEIKQIKDPVTLRSLMGMISGMLGRGSISPEHQKKMQEGRKKAK